MNSLQGAVVIKIFLGMSSQFKSSEQESINKTKLCGGGQSCLLFKGGCSHLGHKNVWVPAGWHTHACVVGDGKTGGGEEGSLSVQVACETAGWSEETAWNWELGVWLLLLAVPPTNREILSK